MENMNQKMIASSFQGQAVQPREEDGLVEFRDGGWYITIGNPGFNSPANNRRGYKSQAAALAATRRYASKRTTVYPAWVKEAIADRLG